MTNESPICVFSSQRVRFFARLLGQIQADCARRVMNSQRLQQRQIVIDRVHVAQSGDYEFIVKERANLREGFDSARSDARSSPGQKCEKCRAIGPA